MSDEICINSAVKCPCGSTIKLTGDTIPLRGICGKFTTHKTRLIFYARASCRECSLIHDPDHKQLAGCFNELAYRLSNLDR